MVRSDYGFHKESGQVSWVFVKEDTRARAKRNG